jgi:2-(3-amino-3-carboxypropyl)histidine synthase
MAGFDLQEDRIRQEIAKRGAKRVLLQLPEGLKPQGPCIAKIVEMCGAVAVISSDPCYGACDIGVAEAEVLGADLIVHFGHAPFVAQGKIPALYVEARAEVSVDVAVLQALPLLANYQKIGLVTSVQHLQTLAQAKKLLETAGKTVLVGEGGQLPYAGQVIGCNYINATAIAPEVEAFLFVGGGVFHALGVALSTGKPTIVADPYDNRAFSIDLQAQKVLKQRWAAIEESQSAKVFGVLVGLKPGQRHMEQALKVKALAEKHGRAAFLLAGREITPDTLLEFPSFDAYVNTACPRISLEAPQKFSKPILTVNEFMVAIGEASWRTCSKKDYSQTRLGAFSLRNHRST